MYDISFRAKFILFASLTIVTLGENLTANRFSPRTYSMNGGVEQCGKTATPRTIVAEQIKNRIAIINLNFAEGRLKIMFNLFYVYYLPTNI